MIFIIFFFMFRYSDPNISSNSFTFMNSYCLFEGMTIIAKLRDYMIFNQSDPILMALLTQPLNIYFSGEIGSKAAAKALFSPIKVFLFFIKN